jgi:hypothetical protein
MRLARPGNQNGRKLELEGHNLATHVRRKELKAAHVARDLLIPVINLNTRISNTIWKDT